MPNSSNEVVPNLRAVKRKSQRPLLLTPNLDPSQHFSKQVCDVGEVGEFYEVETFSRHI